MFYKMLHLTNDLKTHTEPSDSRCPLNLFVNHSVNINVAKISKKKKKNKLKQHLQKKNKIKRARLTVDLCVLWIVVTKETNKKYIF